MSSLGARGFLRAPRRGAEISLGADGRPRSDEEMRAELVASRVTGEAASIVELAQERADELVRTAALTAATVQQEAYAEGFAAGHRDGDAAARAELVQAIALVQHVAGAAKAMRDQLVTQAEREIVELVIEAATAVVGDRIAADPELVHETVRRALQRAGSQNVLRVRVAPEEQERVAVRLAEDHAELTELQVLADRTVRVGGCMVDTDAGRVDARLDVQLDQIAGVLRNALPARPSDDWEDADAR